MDEIILQVRNLSMQFGKEKVLDNISFDLHRCEILGIVGESGSGKSTLLRAIAQIIKPTAGNVLSGGLDLTAIHGKKLKNARKNIQMVFQDTFSSLDPKMKIGKAIEEPLEIHTTLKKKEREAEVLHLLEAVSLNPEIASRYPSSLSGGERQRVVMARALSLNPEIILADEPLSALDVSVQAQLIGLIDSIRNKGTSFILVSHDISAIRCISDRIAVMHSGKIVEIGETEAVCSNPSSQYTRRLLEAKNAKGLSYCHGQDHKSQKP